MAGREKDTDIKVLIEDIAKKTACAGNVAMEGLHGIDNHASRAQVEAVPFDFE